MISDYMKYRGKCKELCEQAIKDDTTLTLIRGHYFCPIWNKDEPHWWTKKQMVLYLTHLQNSFHQKGLAFILNLVE